MIDWSKMKTAAQRAEEQRRASIPQEIFRWQGVLQLKRAGLWEMVEAAYEAMAPGPEKDNLEAALFHTMMWRRDSPALLAMASALGLTELAVDEMFIAAAQIVV